MTTDSKIIPFRALRAQRNAAPIKMARKKNDGEIYIYDMIGAGFFEDGVTAAQFAKDVKALGEVETLNVYINSPGGSVFEGVTIENVIARQKAKKVVHIDGLAASIASVIAMAGDEIRIAENAMMMIHNPWSMVVGDSKDMRKMADDMDKVAESILATYVSRTGGVADNIAAMMDAETWMTAEEAIEHGFADSLTEKVDMAALANFDLSLFHNLPDTLTDQPDAASPAEPVSASLITPHPAVAEANARLLKRQAEQRLNPAK